MQINWHARELNLKIVYYGPALSGKTTNLEKIHDRVDPSRRSDLVSLKTHEDRTLFFDFLQLDLGSINGLTPKLHLYTVPGQTYYETSRRLVLRGSDGIVFVADSAADADERNVESWECMQEQLGSYDLSVSSIPVVVQCNKQDLPGAVSPEHMQQLLKTNGIPVIPSVAVNGDGVFDTLKEISSGVMSRIQSQISKGIS